MNWDAWAAGLIEGEGHLSSRRDKRTDYPAYSIHVTMTDLDVLEQLDRVFPGGKIWQDKFRPSYKKTAWRWNLHKRELVRDLLQRIRPYLGKRRGDKADEIIKGLAIKLDFCRNGHPKTEDNIYRHRGKLRFCRLCRAEQSRKVENQRDAAFYRDRYNKRKLRQNAAPR